MWTVTFHWPFFSQNNRITETEVTACPGSVMNIFNTKTWLHEYFESNLLCTCIHTTSNTRPPRHKMWQQIKSCWFWIDSQSGLQSKDTRRVDTGCTGHCHSRLFVVLNVVTSAFMSHVSPVYVRYQTETETHNCHKLHVCVHVMNIPGQWHMLQWCCGSTL